MPTVHLALPESMYNELKNRAAELGIQVTDLIKLYIRMGLDRGYGSSSNVEGEILASLARRVEKLEKDLKLKVTIVEGKMREVDETLRYVIERLEMIEEIVSELKARRLAEKSSYS